MTPDELLPTATRIADALLEVQHRVNEQVEATHAELIPGVQARLGTEPGGAVDPGDLVDQRITGASAVVTPAAVAAPKPMLSAFFT